MEAYVRGDIKAHFSAAASGSFFAKSPCSSFIVKTMTKAELSTLLAFLPEYAEHLQTYPRSLLCRFYGAFALSGSLFKTTYFVVMSNVLNPTTPASSSTGPDHPQPLSPPHPPTTDFDLVFDLKGSTVNRAVLSQREIAAADGSVATAGDGRVLKDSDFLARGCKLLLGPTLRSAFLDQLAADTDLLARNNLMDYSVLVGIKSIPGSPAAADLETAAALTTGYDHLGSLIISRNTVETVLPIEWYALGLIDLLQTYNLSKKLERGIKKVRHTSWKLDISSIKPDAYARRLLDFFTSNTT